MIGARESLGRSRQDRDGGVFRILNDGDAPRIADRQQSRDPVVQAARQDDRHDPRAEHTRG